MQSLSGSSSRSKAAGGYTGSHLSHPSLYRMRTSLCTGCDITHRSLPPPPCALPLHRLSLPFPHVRASLSRPCPLPLAQALTYPIRPSLPACALPSTTCALKYAPLLTLALDILHFPSPHIRETLPYPFLFPMQARLPGREQCGARAVRQRAMLCA